MAIRCWVFRLLMGGNRRLAEAAMPLGVLATLALAACSRQEGNGGVHRRRERIARRDGHLKKI